jgi:hypothetical protein
MSDSLTETSAFIRPSWLRTRNDELLELELVEAELEAVLAVAAPDTDEPLEDPLLLAPDEPVDPELPTASPIEPETEATVPLIGALSLACLSASSALLTLSRACSTVACADAALLAVEEDEPEDEPAVL